jgi:phosphoribosylformylglycinamidine synthase
LDKIPKKYEGLDGTELAISESQERMAVVVEKDKAQKFISLANAENLEAVIVAVITEEKNLVMSWRGKTIVSLSRDFLNSNGAEKHSDVYVPSLNSVTQPAAGGERLLSLAGDINFASKKGLFERFDSTIGALTILAPAGGKYQLTPPQVMCAKIPVSGETTTCSAMSFGFDPFISEKNPYRGAYLAVTSSAAKLIAAGIPRKSIYLSLQEYFPKLKKENWHLPFSALLGALQAEMDLGIAAIGGKDSMSGTFENLEVPPTLVSFAVGTGNVNNIISCEFKNVGSAVYCLKANNVKSFLSLLDYIEKLIYKKEIVSAWTIQRFGIAEAIIKMSLGNRMGFQSEASFKSEDLFTESLLTEDFCSFIIEASSNIKIDTENFSVKKIGNTIAEYVLLLNKTEGVEKDSTQSFKQERISLEDIQKVYEEKFESIMPYKNNDSTAVPCLTYTAKKKVNINLKTKPLALIPVFPGTNCEYDTERALIRAGAAAEIFVINNLNSAMQSAKILADKINKSNMLVIPGGFSGGDEPDGSAKLISAFFRCSYISEAITKLLDSRDGLILGICNGFQALIKLGLVPYGKITDIQEDFPTLTFNTIGRHQSMMVNTKICSTLSPWFLAEKLGAVHTIPVSHGEGRFVASSALINELAANGQIASQYVDLCENPTMDLRYNPAGSAYAIEAITSKDGRVLGKMAHSERAGNNLYKNIYGNKFQKLFEGGVQYFS